MSEVDEIERALDSLRNQPNFKLAVLDQLRAQFLASMTDLGTCAPELVESRRGVLLYIADLYENLAGQPVTGEDV